METSMIGRSRRYVAVHQSITDFSGKARVAQNHDAHVVAYQLDALLAAATKLPNVGRPLEAQKWFQRDFRSWSPRHGSVGKRVACKRWAEH